MSDVLGFLAAMFCIFMFVFGVIFIFDGTADYKITEAKVISISGKTYQCKEVSVETIVREK